MVITKQNIDNFVDITVDCILRLHHYYPLTIQQREGQYYYVDATGTWIVFNDKDVIYYDFIRKPELKGGGHQISQYAVNDVNTLMRSAKSRPSVKPRRPDV